MSNSSGSTPWTNISTMLATQGAADSALGVGERCYSDVDALSATNCAVLWPIPCGHDYIELRFRGKTNGDNHIMDVWMGNMESDLVAGVKNASLRRVASLDVEIGTQQDCLAETNYTLLADEITVTNATTQSPGGNATAYQSSNDSELYATVVIPIVGMDSLALHGHTTFANNL